MTKYVLNKKDSLKEFEELCGGKSTSVKKMNDLGVPVPEFISLTNDALNEFINKNQLNERINILIEEGKYADIETVFVQAEIPPSIQDKIYQCLSSNNLNDTHLAIRSSGLDEDGVEYSFAGLFSSYLFQKNVDDIITSIKKCWASAYSERAISYRKENKLLIQNIKMGVLIQKMVNSTKSGVLFTQNPIKINQNKTTIIEALWGQGEGLVSGELDADRYEVHKLSTEISSTINKKEKMYTQDPQNAGIKLVDLDKNLKETTTLNDSEILEVFKLGLDLELKVGHPLDIEWAYENDSLYILQMRPITNIPGASFYDSTINGDTPILWDNSNIVESFNGVTTPLTFSATRKSYATVYRQTSVVMGVPPEIIDKFEYEFNHMLGMVRGRVYYNLRNWYQLLVLIPGISSSESFMETMMGVKDDLSPDLKHILDFQGRIPEYSLGTKLKVAKEMFVRFRNIDKIVDDFLSRFEKIYNDTRSQDLYAKSLPELADIYDYLQREVTREWKPPIINDVFVMIFFGTLKSLTEKWLIIDESVDQNIHNNLLCGEGDVISTMPTKTLMKLAAKIDSMPDNIRSKFLDTHCDNLWELISSNEEMSEIHADMEDFLDKYGFRCSNEQKLEDDDLTDEPSLALNMVQSYIRMKSYSIEEMEARELKIRKDAEQVVLHKLKGIKRRIYNWVLKHARNAVKNRENLRFARTKSFGLTRKIFRAMGHHLVELGIIEEDRDIFYLHIDELLDSIRGCAPSLKFKEIIKIRKAEFEEYRNSPAPPERFVTYGAAIASLTSNQIISSGDLLADKVRISDDPNVIYGVSCCPGVIEKEVRVAETINDTKDMNGEILITYRTDPGWVPVFPNCGGLIIERGSLLSHSAVIARELGLPTIVGVHGDIFSKVKTGDIIILDATKGEIRIKNED
jgi:phosphohistidine swiveling domain-containing protein